MTRASSIKRGNSPQLESSRSTRTNKEGHKGSQRSQRMNHLPTTRRAAKASTVQELSGVQVVNTTCLCSKRPYIVRFAIVSVARLSSPDPAQITLLFPSGERPRTEHATVPVVGTPCTACLAPRTDQSAHDHLSGGTNIMVRERFDEAFRRSRRS